MTLRMVAGLSSMPCFLAIVREPTGSAVLTKFSTTAPRMRSALALRMGSVTTGTFPFGRKSSPLWLGSFFALNPS